MDEYLKTLLEQIRCKQARSMVEEEIRGHMEEQIEENIAEGMDEIAAVEAAVEDMGNPVEVGISMDALHRPAMEKSMLILVGMISLLSIGIQIFIGRNYAELGQNWAVRHGTHILIGFLVMMLIYRLDYSVLGKYAKLISGGGLLLLVLAGFFGGTSVNGVNAWIWFPFFNISAVSLLYLFVPLYGGILYQYYGERYKGIGKAVLWMLFPAIIAVRSSQPGQAAILFYVQGIMLSIAVWKGWFCVQKKKFLSAFWIGSVTLPVLFLYLGVKFRWLAEYQITRINTSLGLIKGDENCVNLIKEAFLGSRLIGTSERGKLLYGNIYNSYDMFTLLSVDLGRLAAVVTAVCIIILSVKVLKTAAKQKNQLGNLMGYGCGLLFLAETAVQVLMGTGMIPPVESFLPFISSGGSNIVVSYALVGVVLSIYRYKNILPDKRKSMPKKLLIE